MLAHVYLLALYASRPVNVELNMDRLETMSDDLQLLDFCCCVRIPPDVLKDFKIFKLEDFCGGLVCGGANLLVLP